MSFPNYGARRNPNPDQNRSPESDIARMLGGFLAPLAKEIIVESAKETGRRKVQDTRSRANGMGGVTADKVAGGVASMFDNIFAGASEDKEEAATRIKENRERAKAEHPAGKRYKYAPQEAKAEDDKTSNPSPKVQADEAKSPAPHVDEALNKVAEIAAGLEPSERHALVSSILALVDNAAGGLTGEHASWIAALYGNPSVR